MYRSYLGILRLMIGHGHQTWRAPIAQLLILPAALGPLLSHSNELCADRHSRSTPAP